jgi:hypothetical protein
MTRGYIPPNARNLETNMEKLSEPLSSGMSSYMVGLIQILIHFISCMSFEDIMAVLEDLDEGLKSSWAPSVEDDD